MAEIRLNKLTKQFNIGLQTLVDFLNGKGAGLESLNPNAKVSDEYLPDLEKAFGKDLKAKEDSEKVRIKIKEIIEKDTKKKEEEEDEPAKEIVIVSTALSSGQNAAPQPVENEVSGTEAGEEVKEAPETAVPAKPEISAPVVEEPVAPVVETEPAPVAVPEPAEKVEEELPEAVAAEEVRKDEPEEKPEQSEEADLSAQTPAETAAAVAVVHRSDVKKADRANKEEFNPKADKAKLKAEHKLQKAASSKDEEPETASTGLKIVGKVDLSQFEPKRGKKRERINKGGSQKVDVNKIDGEEKGERKDKDKNKNRGGQNNNGRKDQRQNQPSGKAARRKERMNEKFKPAMTAAEEEEMQKEIQKQVKETYARMNDSKSKNNFGAKHRKEKRELASQKLQEEMAQEAAEKKILKVTEFVTVNDLATLMNNTPVNKVIEACFSLGLMVSINQRLDAEALVLVAEEFGYKVEFVTADIQNEINQ